MNDMSIGTFGGATTAQPVVSEATQGLDKDMFLKILVAQVKYQNPLEPTDSSEMLGQAAQYAMVEQLESVAKAQAEMRAMQMVSIATGMVGEEIVATDELSGEVVAGIVEGVRFGTEPILIVDGFEVPLSSVISVGENTEFGAPPPNDAPPDPADDVPVSTDTGTDASIKPDQTPTSDQSGPDATIEPNVPIVGDPLAVEPDVTPQSEQPQSDPRLDPPIEAVRDEVTV